MKIKTESQQDLFSRRVDYPDIFALLVIALIVPAVMNASYWASVCRGARRGYCCWFTIIDCQSPSEDSRALEKAQAREFIGDSKEERNSKREREGRALIVFSRARFGF
jgi:hypothetical protein